METTDPFKHCVRVNVRFNDIDLLHHVNNSAYCSMLDEGRVIYFRDVGENRFDWSEINFVLVNLNLNFKASAHLFDKVEVFTRVVRIGNKSLTMEQEIRLRPEGKLLVNAISVVSGYNRKMETSEEITPEWINAFESFEGRVLKER